MENDRNKETSSYQQGRPLGEEIDYLLRTGIIILLNGAPTIGLERDIARKLAEVHGLPIERYNV
jgi:hypothetical protein